MSMARIVLFGLLCAIGMSSCSRSEAPVAEADYAAKIVGGWRGNVGGDTETISFSTDGKFVSQVRPRGFISNTLGQGVTGTIGGTWEIVGKDITLNIESAEDAHVLNTVAKSTIESFKPNELILKSSTGDTSTFLRLL